MIVLIAHLNWSDGSNNRRNQTQEVTQSHYKPNFFCANQSLLLEGELDNDSSVETDQEYQNDLYHRQISLSELKLGS